MDWLEEFKKNPEFMKLQDIGGHKVYHLEGNALKHTEMVYKAAMDRIGDVEAEERTDIDNIFLIAAALHDIGKIYTSIRHGDDDWEYPDHAQCGAFRGILCKFIPENDPYFKPVQWYIKNHIKPLFWVDKPNFQEEMKKIMEDAPEWCYIDELVDLALCDIEGSKCVDDRNMRTKIFLQGLHEYLNL